MVRAKFYCSWRSEDGKVIHLGPVVTGSRENEHFYDLTPGGSIELFTINPEAAKQFELGKEYYVDFSPAV